MPIDFRPPDLDTKCKTETMHHMSIRHKKSGIVVAGSDENKFVLECQLLEKLRQKLKKEEENGRASKED